MGSSAGEDADGGQCDSVSSGVWSTHSIASRTCAERQPERRLRRCTLGSRWLARSRTKLSRTKNIRRSGWAEEEAWGKKGGAGVLVLIGIDDRRWQRLQEFHEKFVGLVRSFARERKREGRGGPGLFIGDWCLAGGGRVRVRGGDRQWGASGLSSSAARGRRRVYHVGPRCQWEREEEERTSLGNTPGGLWAGFGAGPNRSPTAFYSFSDFLFPFLILWILF
jgi:hypothetical protein